MLSRSIFVELSRSSSHGKEALGALFRRTNRLALIAGAVIIALIATIGRPLLGFIAGSDFLPAYPLLLLLGLQAALLPLYGTIGAAVANIVAALAGFAMMGWASRRAVASDK